MGLKDLLKRKEKNEIEETTTIDTEIPDIPKVVFEDSKLQIKIGQWLYGFQQHDFENIPKKFGELFKLAGINSSETCVLSQSDEDKFSFNCHFNNADDNASISMRDSMPQFTIDYHNCSNTYDYAKADEDRPMLFILRYRTLTNSENGNKVWRMFTPLHSSIKLFNKDYTLSIDVDEPHIQEEDELKKTGDIGDYILKNEKELEQYLSKLTFPVAIDEVYKKVCELSLGPVSQYPKLTLKVTKGKDRWSSVTTDLIAMDNGQLTDFVITKNEKTISFDVEKIEEENKNFFRR